MEHTPGPWVIISHKYDAAPKEIITGIGVEMEPGYFECLFNTILPGTDAEYVKQHEQILANVKLATAAPALLEAARLGFEFMALCADGHNIHDTKRLAAIILAINKAGCSLTI